MLKSIVFSFRLAMLLSCNQNKNFTSTKHTTSTSNKRDSALQQEDFTEFFKKFDSDSVFQRTRIKFPLKIVDMDETGEKQIESYISAKEISHIGIGSLKEPNMILKKKQVAMDKFEIQFTTDDTGYEVNYFFERRLGKWFLISVRDLSD